MKKGDTIIEVILAFSVFSAAMMGGLWLMNNAMARAQASLQLTMARNAMDGQAESLRYLNSLNLARQSVGVSLPEWSNIPIRSTPSALNFCPQNISEINGFVVNMANMTILRNTAGNNNRLRPADTYPRLEYNVADTNDISGGDIVGSRGLWIEAVRANNSDNFIDFHIRACWNAPGQNAPTTLGTIVRLYNAN
ncbi:MAG: hypothetical protein Q4A21_00380 [bacterium]|nr:hypothetical protein [bacterium]